MKSERKLPGRWDIVACIAVVVTAVVFSPEQSPSASSDVQDPSGYVVGTVRSTYAENRILEVITGAGYAVRLERIGVASDCVFHVPGAKPVLSSIRRGACVRIGCIEAPADAPVRRIALTVEVIEFDQAGGIR